MDHTDPASEQQRTLDGKYLLEEVIGQGGGGRVYRARQQSTGQPVAVKILEVDRALPERALERRRERFRREMVICGTLDHPDVVGLIDYGERGDTLYTVFELVQGRTLSELLELEGALPIPQWHALMRQMLDVLVHAHRKGVIHRDLKPSNLMVLGEGERARIKVLDFGVSAIPLGRFAGTPERLTMSNETIGTPTYAAPEQLRGDAPSVRTDLYSWGLIALECLTGVRVIRGTSLGEIFQRQLSPEPIPLPAPLQAHPLGVILRWALEKDPSRRAGSATELLQRFDVLDPASLAALANEAGFYADPASPRTQEGSDVPRTVAAPLVRPEGQRRQITALCCRLVFRTHERDEPLETGLVDAYRADLFRLCRETVEDLRGRFLGGFADLVSFCFGVPRASDTDVRLAVRAALELSVRVRARSSVLRAQSGVSVELHAGIHSGLLDAAAPGPGPELAHSSVVAIATALTEATGESSIRVSETFRRLAQRHGEFEPEERPRGLDDANAPEPIHRLVKESLSDALGESAAPLQGRRAELDELRRALDASRARARFVLLRGEAGMGKSRLIHELRSSAGHEERSVFGLRCLPELQHVALAPLLEAVRGELGLPLRPSCADLARSLDGLPVELPTAVPLLAPWLAVSLEPPFQPLPFSPQKQRGMLYGLLTDLVHARLRRSGGYLQVEDLHWADPSTLEWLGHWMRTRDADGFVVMTARPELVPPWADGPELHVLELGPLADDDVVALVGALPLDTAVGPEAMRAIVARADGVPLFVEELARALATRTHEGAALVTLPVTLRDLMTSRLDALGDAKETVQYAAAIGREFDLGLLQAALQGKDEATLLADLAQLTAAGIVLRQREVGRQNFLFRHALLRDASHESMTPAKRRDVHATIADALLQHFPERIEARPDLAALHLELAGDRFGAQRHWLLAGRKAHLAAAVDEAIAHLSRGVRVCGEAATDPAFRTAELDLLNVLSAAQIAKFGYGSPQLQSSLERAETLLDAHETSVERQFLTMRNLWAFKNVRAEVEAACGLGRRLLELADRNPDYPKFELGACFALCESSFVAGAHAEAIRQGERCIARYDFERDHDLVTDFGEDPKLGSMSWVSIATLVAGQPDRALTLGEDAIAFARRLGHPNLLAGTLANHAWLHLVRGSRDRTRGPDLQRARDLAAQAIGIGVEHGFQFWILYGSQIDASARILAGDLEAIPAMEASVQTWTMIGARLARSWQLSVLAVGYHGQGDRARAMTSLDEALAHAHEWGEGFFLPELHRLRASFLDRDDPQKREALRRAIDIADRQGARMLHLWPCLDLAGLLEPDEAAALLRPVASWWRRAGEGADSPSVQEALAWANPAPSNSMAGRDAEPR